MNVTPASAGARYQALIQLLRTADSLWNSSRRFFARWNLSPSQFNVLNLLSDQPAGISQIELSRQLIMHRSNVTGLVDRLERQGRVQRRTVAGDRRAYQVTLTPAGWKLIRRVLPEYYRLADRIWQNVPASRARRLAADLQRLAREAETLFPGKESS